MAFFKKKIAEIDMSDFDQAVRELSRRHAPKDAAIVDGPGDTLNIGDHIAYLHNLRLKWHEHEPADREPWLDGVLQGIYRDANTPPQLHLAQLRAGVRSRATLETISLQGGQEGGLPTSSTMPTAPIAADLVWCLIADSPTTMQIATTDQVAENGRSFEELLQIGKDNLAADSVQAWECVGDLLFVPVGEDDYAGARLLLPGALDGLPISGEKVVFQPTRRRCLVADAGNSEGLRIAAELALSLKDEADPVSLTPIIGDTDNWRPLELSYTHPAFEAVHKLIVVDLASGYATQQAVLNTHLDDELFVATYSAKQTSNGEIFSMCTWSEDVDTLLPRTDIVAFFQNPEIPVFLVPWKAVEEICGHRLEPTNHYPARVRVLDFPDPPELEQLRAERIEL
ncbi:MAG: hypothetical protein R8J94_11345 [Acidimicrobiia bacterium]|nr:hypothetical protein [Acidimicrobiia bacterium]